MNLIIKVEFEVYPTDAPEILTWQEAINYCKKLGEGWRLPSKEELSFMYLEHKKGLGGFIEGIYVSSSEYNRSNIWFQYFNDGGQEYFGKGRISRVRAVRDIK